MICKNCIQLGCDQCDNYFTRKGLPQDIPTKTWCDCQHKTGIYIDSLACGHVSMTKEMTNCPSCGKNPEALEAEAQRRVAFLEAQKGAAGDG